MASKHGVVTLQPSSAHHTRRHHQPRAASRPLCTKRPRQRSARRCSQSGVAQCAMQAHGHMAEAQAHACQHCWPLECNSAPARLLFALAAAAMPLLPHASRAGNQVVVVNVRGVLSVRGCTGTRLPAQACGLHTAGRRRFGSLHTSNALLLPLQLLFQSALPAERMNRAQ